VSLLSSATDFQELIAFKGLNAAGKCVDGNGAVVDMVNCCPGGDLSKCEKYGIFSGKVIVGFGDFCDDPTNPSRRGLRELEVVGQTETATFSTSPFQFSTTEPETEKGCDGFFDIICWVVTFLRNLLALVGIKM